MTIPNPSENLLRWQPRWFFRDTLTTSPNSIRKTAGDEQQARGAACNAPSSLGGTHPSTMSFPQACMNLPSSSGIAGSLGPVLRSDHCACWTTIPRPNRQNHPPKKPPNRPKKHGQMYIFLYNAPHKLPCSLNTPIPQWYHARSAIHPGHQHPQTRFALIKEPLCRGESTQKNRSTMGKPLSSKR